jgi:hypothetical protein
MIRIPGSHNFKCVQKNNNVSDESTKVKTIQSWDGHRPKINLLLGSFYAYLVDQEINEVQKQKRFRKSYGTPNNNTSNVILWIEKLLQTPIEDYRKNTVALILAPYLVNIKKLPYTESYNVIKGWLDKCNSLRRLDSDFNYRIKYALENVIKTGYKPMRFEKLREYNEQIYEKLRQR